MVKRVKTSLYVFLLVFFISGNFIASSLKLNNRVFAQGSQPSQKILVKLKESPKTSSLLSISDNLPQAQLLGGIPTTNVVVYKVEGDINQAIADVKSNVNVETAFEDKKVFLQKTTNDTYYTNQWALTNMKVAGADSGWDKISEITNKTAQVKVAVIDTGIDVNHEDFSNKIDTGDMITCVYTTGDSNLDCTSGGVDDHGHGTHVAGIIGAVTDNQKGIAGVGWGVKLMSVKVLGADGSGSLSDALIGMYYAADHGAKVLNLSLGAPKGGTDGLTDDDIAVIQSVVDDVIEKGVVVVAASGNCGDSGSGNNAACGNLVNPIMYPAAATNVISVASLDRNNNLAPYSEHGNWVSLAAPGGNCSSDSNKNDCILSTLPTSINCTSLGFSGPANGYCYLQGTSMASPQVAGVAALLLSAKEGITNNQVKDIIFRTANAVIAKGTNATIYGGVDALMAINEVLNQPSNTPGPSPLPTAIPSVTLYPTTGIAKLPKIPPDPYPSPPYCPVTGGGLCDDKKTGDADCNFAINLNDYNIWTQQYDKLVPPVPLNPNANFSCVEGNNHTYFVDLVDYEIWRRNTISLRPSNTPIPPTKTPTPRPPTNTPGQPTITPVPTVGLVYKGNCRNGTTTNNCGNVYNIVEDPNLGNNKCETIYAPSGVCAPWQTNDGATCFQACMASP